MKNIRIKCMAGLLALLLTACSTSRSMGTTSSTASSVGLENTSSGEEKNDAPVVPFAGTITPETLEVFLNEMGSLPASLAGNQKNVDGLETSEGRMHWQYTEDNISVSMTQNSDYLDVEFRYTGDLKQEATMTWPIVSAEDYTLPIGEGKRFDAGDPLWVDYLVGEEWATIESFSMSFLAAGYGEKAIVYVFPKNFSNDILFTEGTMLGFSVRHTFSTVNPDKTYHIRVYITENNPVEIAGVYKRYVQETAGIKTLAEKAEENPNIEKLYGAPHIYLHDKTVISEEDVNWPAFQKSLDTPTMQYVLEFAEKHLDSDSGFASVIEEVKAQDYVSTYQRQVITQGISQLLLLPEFYNDASFPQRNETTVGLLKSGKSLTRTDEILLNKHALAANLPGVFQPVETWANSRTSGLLEAVADSGIEHAWIGLNDWEQAYIKPELTTFAQQQGWLIGPYDSYHSVHKPGKEEWATATFPPEVYSDYTIQRRDGAYVSGFQAVGRKLNPTLSLPYVQSRVKEILENPVQFNSWFVDCDATGEIYDDYRQSHPTSMEQDYDARLGRMSFIAVEHNMVVGSEGGNDYAANTIAFAHGIELQSFSWMDDDMKNNRESEYYLGRWYAANGGVPEKFAKPVPVKEKYYNLFLNPVYTVPLYKLVYNNAVITANHWDWPTLKIQGQENDRMLYEMLYNVPPMYHLDKFLWEEYSEDITSHVQVWSAWSQQIVSEEVTDFQYLTEDKLVQIATYGSHSIIVNWSDKTFINTNITIEPGMYVIK